MKIGFLFVLCATVSLSAMEIVEPANKQISAKVSKKRSKPARFRNEKTVPPKKIVTDDMVTEVYFNCLAPEKASRYFELCYDPWVAWEDPAIDEYGRILPVTTPPEAVQVLHTKYGAYAEPVLAPEFSKKYLTSSFKWFQFAQREPFSFSEVKKLLMNNWSCKYGFCATRVLAAQEFKNLETKKFNKSLEKLRTKS